MNPYPLWMLLMLIATKEILEIRAEKEEQEREEKGQYEEIDKSQYG